MIDDSDEEQARHDIRQDGDDSEFEAGEDEVDPDCPYPNIIQKVDVNLKTGVTQLAIPSIPAAARTNAVSQYATFVAACSDGTQRVITFDLSPPTDVEVKQYGKEVSARALTFEAADSLCTAVAAKIVLSDDEEGSRTSFLFVAVVSNYLRIYRIAMFNDPTLAENTDVETHEAHLPHAVSNIGFHPSPSSAKLVLSDIGGAVRIYDPFAQPAARAVNDSSAKRPGSWLISFLVPYITTHSHAAHRKRILDAKWVLSGRAVMLLLEDGQWGIWDTQPPSDSARSLSDFAISGYVGNHSETSLSSKPSRGSSRLAPMTPNTRQARTETFFAGPAQPVGVAPRGGISVSPSSYRSGQADESVVLWYNSDVFSISSLQTFWQRSQATITGNLLHAAGMTRISDLNLANETITSISQLPRSVANSGVGQMNTQRDLLVAAEHRLIILQTLRPTGPARQLFQDALAVRPAPSARDQRMLDAGELDVGGLDRMLDSMDARPRKVGFAAH